MSKALIISIVVLTVVIASIFFFGMKKKPMLKAPDLVKVQKTPTQGTQKPLAKVADEKNNTKMPVETTDTTGNVSSGILIKEMTTEEKLQVKKPTVTIDLSKTYTAKINTSDGVIEILLDAKNKPITANNFVYLANLGFYNDLIFHRIVNGFMIQGGDPLGNGQGGPAYKFKDEFGKVNENKVGTIAMANSGPDTNGSQFFINLVDNNFLDTRHTVFGEVIKGMDVVEKIAKSEVKHGPSGELSTPVTPIKIESVEIIVE